MERPRPLGRLSVLAGLIGGQHPLVPAANRRSSSSVPFRAFPKTLPKRRLIAATRVLRVGQMLDLGKAWPVGSTSAYEAVSVVEAAGQFSRRGGIIDIFPPRPRG